MKIKFICIIVVSIFFCDSCKNINTKLEYEEPVFEDETNVDVNIINNKFLFNQGKILVVDSLIIYGGLTDVSDKAFHIFSKNTGEYLLSFGNIGRSKGEISGPRSFSLDKERKLLYLYDVNLGKAVSYSLEKVLNGDNDYAKELKLPEIMNNIVSQHFFYLKNSFLGCYSNSGRFLVCSENDSITCNDFYPTLDEPKQYKKVEHQYFFYLGCMSVKPDGDMFVHATRNGCIMEIWKNEGTIISPYIVKGFYKPNYISSNRDLNYPQVLPNMDDPHGISLLSCTNKYIYALFNNVPTVSSNKIAVFDWKGNPKIIYETNRIFYSFDADNDNSIYALARNEKGNIELIVVPLK